MVESSTIIYIDSYFYLIYKFIKALKSTHRHPVNKILHCIGAFMYIPGIGLISGSLNGFQTNPVNGIILWSTAVGLFFNWT